MTSKTKVRGHISYNQYFGYVCTCTATREQDAKRATFEDTVSVGRKSEYGTYWFSCSRCGAGAWISL